MCDAMHPWVDEKLCASADYQERYLAPYRLPPQAVQANDSAHDHSVLLQDRADLASGIMIVQLSM